jgi:3-deoxy-D-manno-octulosonic acid (KDO) 8-phosphate synthase
VGLLWAEVFCACAEELGTVFDAGRAVGMSGALEAGGAGAEDGITALEACAVAVICAGWLDSTGALPLGSARALVSVLGMTG